MLAEAMIESNVKTLKLLPAHYEELVMSGHAFPDDRIDLIDENDPEDKVNMFLY